MIFDIVDRDPVQGEAAIYTYRFMDEIFYVGSTVDKLKDRAIKFKSAHKLADLDATFVVSVICYVPVADRYRIERVACDALMEAGYGLVNKVMTSKFSALRSELAKGQTNAMKEFCKRGHDMANARVVQRPNGVQRTCRECEALRSREYRSRKNANE